MGFISSKHSLFWHIIRASNVKHDLKGASASFGWNRLFHQNWTLKQLSTKLCWMAARKGQHAVCTWNHYRPFMPNTHKAFLKINAKALWEQHKKPQLHWLSHVILMQGQNNPIWPSMPQKSLYRWLGIKAIMKTMPKYPWQNEAFTIKYIWVNYWETKSSSWWAEECINMKRQDHIYSTQSHFKCRFGVHWLSLILRHSGLM